MEENIHSVKQGKGRPVTLVALPSTPLDLLRSQARHLRHECGEPQAWHPADIQQPCSPCSMLTETLPPPHSPASHHRQSHTPLPPRGRILLRVCHFWRLLCFTRFTQRQAVCSAGQDRLICSWVIPKAILQQRGAQTRGKALIHRLAPT